MPRDPWCCSAPLPQKVFDPAILERVKRNHSETPPGGQKLLGRGETTIEFPQLVVNGDPQCLECSGGWMLPRLGSRDRVANDIREFEGTPNGPALPRSNYRARNPSGKPFLAECADHPCEIGLRQCRHQIGGARSSGAHPHVQRAVETKRKAALRIVELGRGEAEIKRNSGDRARVHRAQKLRHVAEPAFEDAKAFAITPGQISTASHRVWIPVDAQNSALGRVE